MTELNEAYGVDVNKLMHLVKHGALEELEDLPGELSSSPLPRGEGPGVGTNLEGILPTTKSLQTWIRPGQGEPYPTCGTFYTVGCLEHRPGYAKKVVYNCGRAECPTCWKKWIVDATRKATERIEAGKPRSYKKAIHVTVSPPRELWESMRSKEGYLKIRRKTIRILKIMGVFGGCLIYHPDRGSDRRGWRYSPHFHVVGYGWVRDITRVTPNHPSLKGWVVKNLRIRKSIGATVYYQLSHAGVHRGHHVISWYGSLSWRNLKKLPDPPAELVTCPICGGPLHRIIYWGTGPHPFAGEDDHEELMDLDTVMWTYEA